MWRTRSLNELINSVLTLIMGLVVTWPSAKQKHGSRMGSAAASRQEPRCGDQEVRGPSVPAEREGSEE